MKVSIYDYAFGFTFKPLVIPMERIPASPVFIHQSITIKESISGYVGDAEILHLNKVNILKINEIQSLM